MTDREVEEIIRSNLNLQMNLAGIRGDFEAKSQRTWVGLTEVEMKQTCYEVCSYDPYTIARAIEAKLKEKNT